MTIKIRFLEDYTIRELDVHDALPLIKSGEAEVYIEEPERAVKKHHKYKKAIKI